MESEFPLIMYGMMLLIFLLAGSLFFGVRIVRRTSQDKKEQAQILGFEPYQQPTDHLLRRFSQVFNRSALRLEMENVFYRERGGVDTYLFALRDINNSEAFWFADDGVMIVSQNLALPRFVLFSRVDTLLASGRFMDRVFPRAVLWRIGRTGQKIVRFPESAWFEKNMMVTAEDEDAVRKLLTPVRRSKLAQYAVGHEFFASGDMLAVRRISQSQPATLDQLRQQIHKAFMVYEILY